MVRRVLFYSPLAIWYPHFETELDLIECYLADGCDVTILNCQGELPACAANPLHRKLPCLECTGRFASGTKWLGTSRVHVESFYLLNEAQRQSVKELASTQFNSLEQLKSIVIDDSDIGSAALSSVISALREPYPDIEQNESLIRNHLASAATVHYSLHNHLTQKKPNEFVLFNGRFAELRPAISIAKRLNIDTYVHETGGIVGRYILKHNVGPHDLTRCKREMEELYNTSELPTEEKRRLASQWFEERRAVAAGHLSYVNKQVVGLLPTTLTRKTRNIAVFGSSEDEVATIPGWENPIYADQNEGIRQILEAFEERSDLRFFIRVHPNLRLVNNSQTRNLNALSERFRNVEFIPADSSVSTYSLIDASDIVLTFGSTVGIEALYAQKPSILMGRAVYEDLQGIIRPGSHSNLVATLEYFRLTGELPKTGDYFQGVVRYGFYQMRGGKAFSNVHCLDWFKLRMRRNGKDTVIKPGLLTRMLLRLERWRTGS